MYTNFQLVFDAARVSGNRVFGKRFFARTSDEAQNLAKKMVIEMIGDKVLHHLDNYKIYKNNDPYHGWMLVLEGIPKECLPEELKPTWFGGKIFFWAKENVPWFRGKGLVKTTSYNGPYENDTEVVIPASWVKIKELPREYFGGTVLVSSGSYHRNHRDCSVYWCGGTRYARVYETVIDYQSGPCVSTANVEYFEK